MNFSRGLGKIARFDIAINDFTAIDYIFSISIENIDFLKSNTFPLRCLIGDTICDNRF